MPNVCIVKNCSQNAVFLIPSVIRNSDADTKDITERRRRLWCQQIGRKDLTPETVQVWHRVCSRHFIKGRPAKPWAMQDPDWIPTQHMENENAVSANPKRHGSIVARTKQLSGLFPMSATHSDVHQLPVAGLHTSGDLGICADAAPRDDEQQKTPATPTRVPARNSETEAFVTEEQGQKSSISVTDECIIKQWQTVGTLEKLTEDNDIAQFLLNFYFSSEHQSNGNSKPIIRCAFCQSSLLPVWSCPSCLKPFSFANSGNYQCCRDPKLQEMSAADENPSIFPEVEVKKESFLSEEAEVFQKLADSALTTVSDSQNASPVQTKSDGDEGMLEKVRHETDLPVKQNTCMMPAADKTNANQLQSHAFNVAQVETSLGLKVEQNFTINKNSEPVLNVQGIPNVQNIQSNNISQSTSVKTISILPFNITSVQKQTRSIPASTQSDLKNSLLTSCASEKKEKKTVSLLPQSAGQVVNMPRIFYLSQKNAVDNLTTVKVHHASPSVCKVPLPSGVKTNVSNPFSNKVLLPSDVRKPVTSPLSDQVLLLPNPVSNFTSTILPHPSSDDAHVQRRASDVFPLVTGFGLTTVKSKRDEAKFQQNLQKSGQNQITHKIKLNSKTLGIIVRSRIPCKLCSKSFYSRQALWSHVLAKHKEPKLSKRKEADLAKLKEHNLSCEKCKTYFLNLYSRSGYKHDKSPKKNTSYLCQYCGKMLSTFVVMNNHENMHVGLRPYVCKDCGKGFAEQVNLKQHLLTHTQVKKFICDQCGKAFAVAANMKKHRKRTHEKQTLTHTQVKRFICDLCGKAFTRATHMRNHKKSHGKQMLAAKS